MSWLLISIRNIFSVFARKGKRNYDSELSLLDRRLERVFVIAHDLGLEFDLKLAIDTARELKHTQEPTLEYKLAYECANVAKRAHAIALDYFNAIEHAGRVVNNIIGDLQFRSAGMSPSISERNFLCNLGESLS